MKLICEKAKLEEAIAFCNKAVSPRSPLPILNHLLFKSDRKKLRISATDLELGIEYQLDMESKEAGAFTAPAKIIAEIVASLPQGQVTLETLDGQLKISSHSSEFTISTLSPDEFPHLPHPEGLPVLKLPAATLKDMLKSVSFACASAEETRAILTGVLFSLNENILTMVATDSRRLAKIERNINQLFPEKTQSVVPAHSLNELHKLLKDGDKEVEIAFGEGQIFFSAENLFVMSRVLEGQFPDYQPLLRKDFNSKAVLSRQDLLSAVKRALITAQEKQNPGMVKLSFADNVMEATSNTPDLGQTRENVPVKLEGPGLSIAFNGRYLLDVLNNLVCEEVGLELRDPHTSATLVDPQDPNYLYLIMPIRIREEVYS